MIRLLLAALLLGSSATPAGAQPTLDALRAGARLRVTLAPGAAPAVAVLDSARGDTLFVHPGGAIAMKL